MQVITREDRFLLTGSSAPDLTQDFAEDVRAGLTATPKRLSCRYLYDAEGSRLFEEICEQPEYYLTRCEASILTGIADELATLLGPQSEFVELGSGSADKTRLLLAASARAYGRVVYRPIDISVDALRESAPLLLSAIPELEIAALAAEYVPGLAALRQDDRGEGRRLLLWLGSSIGNLLRPDAAEFMRSLRTHTGERDRMLLGIDLRKDKAVLEAAYDDRNGVTARFNQNLLRRINAELGADFDLNGFDYRAQYDEELGCVQMYQVSRKDVEVHVRSLDLLVEFAAGEAIHTENSFKYSQEEIEELAEAAGFEIEEQWFDSGQRFTAVLLAPDAGA